jgi:hypothetical protein
MKQKIYILGLVTMLITFTGIVLKVNHWPGAAIILALGLGSMALLFIPSALINHYRTQEKRENLSLYIVTGLTCFVVFTAMLFKINHWPNAGLFLMIALPFPYVVFLPAFLVVTSKNKNFNIFNLVFVLCLLAFNSVFSGLLSLNVSKTRIEDSYNLLRNYNNLEKAVMQLPSGNNETSVNKKIDEVIKIADEYKITILKAENISMDQWNSNPGNLLRTTVGEVAGKALVKKEGLPVGARLENALNDLLKEMDNTGGYESFLRIAPEILNCKYPPVEVSDWADRNFIDNFLSWSLMYLDALETNLYLLRESMPAGRKTI